MMKTFLCGNPCHLMLDWRLVLVGSLINKFNCCPPSKEASIIYRQFLTQARPLPRD